MTVDGQASSPPGEVDLHMHSTASDGALAPAAVVNAAHAANLAAIALTDHDTLAGLEEAERTALPLGIRVVAGVELSAYEGSREIHVLALHVANRRVLDESLAGFREGREQRAQRIVEKLRRIGVGVDIDSVMEEAGGGAVGRPHVARALIKGGHVRDSREAFDRFLANGRPGFIAKDRLELREAIDLIHSAGALAVWAHPGPDCRRERLEPMVAMGLDGVEVRHPSHLTEDAKRIGALADFFGLVPSGGSDWHGANEGPRTIGSMHIPPAWLHAQDVVVSRRTAAGAA